MAAYDLLAPHYDAVTGDCSAEAALVHDMIAERHSRAATLLDVACGTGAITARLAGTYQVSGLDISPGMLAVAREKLPRGTALYPADMADFRLDTRFDAIVCSYQGINHLLSLPAWKRFFACAYEHLNDGGVFVFDIATVGYLMTMASIPQIVQQFGDNYLMISVSRTDELIFRWHIEVFELQHDGTYRLLTEAIRMRSFPADQIRTALSPWFAGIEAMDGDRRPADDGSAGRLWFACARRA